MRSRPTGQRLFIDDADTCQTATQKRGDCGVANALEEGSGNLWDQFFEFGSHLIVGQDSGRRVEHDTWAVLAGDSETDRRIPKESQLWLFLCLRPATMSPALNRKADAVGFHTHAAVVAC